MPAEPPAPGAPARPFDTLLGVQELDTSISRLEHRKTTLPARLELAALEREQADLAARAEGPRTLRDALAHRLGELQSQDAALGARLAEIEARLYSSRGVPARELQAMDEEVGHLRRRRSEMEDAELEAMVEQEPLDAELADLDAERERLAGTCDRLRAEVTDGEAVIDAELATARAERDALAGHLPADLAERYETLRARLGGTGAARLVGNRCEGCHLELPAAEVDRIRHQPEDALVTCEQCGRILIRTSAARPPG